jgi:hypothetical protein
MIVDVEESKVKILLDTCEYEKVSKELVKSEIIQDLTKFEKLIPSKKINIEDYTDDSK